MKDCEKYRDAISLGIDGRLGDQETADLLAHLETCSDCAEYMAMAQEVSELMKDAPEPPAELVSGVMERVRRAEADRQLRRRRSRSVWLRRGALGVAALAACAAIVLLPGQARNRNSAASGGADGVQTKSYQQESVTADLCEAEVAADMAADASGAEYSGGEEARETEAPQETPQALPVRPEDAAPVGDETLEEEPASWHAEGGAPADANSGAAPAGFAAPQEPLADSLPQEPEGSPDQDAEPREERTMPEDELESQNSVRFDVQCVRTDGGPMDAVLRTLLVTGYEQLMDYYEANKDIYDFSDPHLGFDDAAPSFEEVIREYGESFFAENQLVLLCFDETSGSIRHEVTDVGCVDGVWTVTVRRIVPEVGTDDMACWHILLSLPEGTLSASDTIRLQFVSD